MTDESTSYSDVLSRRRFIEMTGVAGAAALAGCDQILPDNEEGIHLSWTNQVPSNIQWNMDNPDAGAQVSQFALFEDLAKYNFADAEFKSAALSDWSFASDNGSVDLTVSEDATWETGDAVTADDVARQLKLAHLAGASFTDYVASRDDIEASDDSTVTVTFSGDINPEIVKWDLFNRQLYANQEDYQSFLDDDDQAGYLGFANQEPVASGPWSFEDAGDQRLELVQNEEHPAAGDINFDFHYKSIGDNAVVHQELMNLSIDSAFTVFTPPEVVADMPDEIEEVRTPGGFGFGMIPNHDHEYLGDRAVRQAIMYAIDRDVIAGNVDPRSKTPPTVPTGIAPADQERILGDDLDTFETYENDDDDSTNVDAEAATTVLEDAGYTVGDQVQDSSGNVVSFDFIVPAGWSDWVTAASTIVDQLNTFGFDVSLDSREFGTINDTLWGSGDFALSAGSWLPGAGRASFPYFTLRYQMVAPEAWGWQFNYPAAQENPYGGSLADITVPSMDGESELTRNPSDELQTLSQTSDENEANTIITEQAWIANQDLPVMPVMEKEEQTFLSYNRFDLPDSVSDPEEVPTAYVRWAQEWLPRHGEMTYSGEE